ncbi:MAG TPA: hypothetical protein VG148_08350 [Pyrinomonadaceae bacterium]|nr:hypothetical protein [Pyrinomonadaceae bacterium]
MAEPNRFFSFLDRAVKYWVIWVVLGALLIHVVYGVPYFESIQNSSITTKSSEYYRQLGDRMAEHAEFRAAEEAYLNALKVNPNNIKATHVLMRVQVMNPTIQGGRYEPAVVDSRLGFLKKLFPDDYLLSYWEGIKLRDQRESKGRRTASPSPPGGTRISSAASSS